MQEGIFLETDIDKGRLQPVLEIANLALENAAHEAFLGSALDGELLQPAFFEDADAGFERLGIDDNFFVRSFHRANQRLNFLDDLGGRRANALDQSLRDGFGNLHGLIRQFFHLGGRFQVGFTKILLGMFMGFLRGREPLRWQTRRDIFGTFNFLFVPGFVIDGIVASGLIAEGVGARFIRRAIWPLVWIQSTGRTEAHTATTASRKISITHISRTFDTYGRFAECQWRLASIALRIRRN